MDNCAKQLRANLIMHCEICLKPSNPAINTCKSHYFCQSCIKTYIEYKINQGQVMSIICPKPNCSFRLTHEFIQSIVSRSLYNNYAELFNKKLRELNIYFRSCPAKKCNGFDFKKGGNKLKCNTCNLKFCFLCAGKWHKESPCKEFRDEDFLLWEKQNEIKTCPNCLCATQKIGGCSNILCPKCGISWCWLCRQDNSAHNRKVCIKNSKGFNLYWALILFLMFFPVVFFFIFSIIILMIVLYEDKLIDRYKKRPDPMFNEKPDPILRHKYLILVSSFITSPFFMPLLLVISPVIIWILLPMLIRKKCECDFKFKTILIYLASFIFIPLFGALACIVLGLAFTISPVLGVILLIYKLIN